MTWPRRVFLGLLFALCATSAQAQISAPVLLKTNIAVTNGSAQTVIASSPSGALIVIAALDWGTTGTTFSSVTDSQGNTYTKAISTTPVGGNYGTASIWYCSNALALTSGVDTITMNADTNNLGIIAAYVTGANGGNDANANSDSHTNSTVTSLSMPATGTLAVADEILIWAGSNVPTNWGGLTVSDGTGALTQTQLTSGIAVFYQIVSATTAQTVSYSWTSAAAVGTVLTGFKITGGGAVVVNSRTLTGVGQ